VNLHGHCHPEISAAISNQSKILDQVIFAGFTHPQAVEFSQELVSILPDGLEKIFFSDNGSTAIEVALKMAVQFWSNSNQKKNKIIALEHSYHGDTFGSMSVSERGSFTLPFFDMLFDVIFIPSPAIDPEKCVKRLNEIAGQSDIAAFIYEPLVQGAGGMLMYEPDVLNQMLAICKENQILTIADEVMTGFGRTGKYFASLYLKTQPDIICLSKGITGGFLPLAVTVCKNEIYNSFLSSDRKKTFFHGHSYTGNAISIAAARASLKLLKDSNNLIQNISDNHKNFLLKLANIKNIQNPRSTGTILAFDIKTDENSTYFNTVRDKIYEAFLNEGILLRPLGNTVYFLPPYCITQNQLDYVYSKILDICSKFSKTRYLKMKNRQDLQD
jgi:adenosylmethionine-8-amino-7-oxononanoate aminotransferase